MYTDSRPQDGRSSFCVDKHPPTYTGTLADLASFVAGLAKSDCPDYSSSLHSTKSGNEVKIMIVGPTLQCGVVSQF